MSTNHTPAPWVRWSEENTDGTKVSVCHVANESNKFEADNEHKCVAEVRGTTSKEAEANARLISAAPDLLEACKLALGAFENNKVIDWNILEQAIAKAERA